MRRVGKAQRAHHSEFGLNWWARFALPTLKIPTPTDRARYPSTDSPASYRADSSAETVGRCGAAGARSARTGSARGNIRACCGVRLPLRRLQGEQAATTFSQVVWPPLLRGMMWSKVRSSCAPQYWQAKRSRRKTLNRVKAGCVVGLTKDFSETTLGSCISKRRAVHRPIVVLDDVDAVEEHRLDRVLPRPERQRVITQRPEIRIQHQYRPTALRDMCVQVTLLASHIRCEAACD